MYVFLCPLSSCQQAIWYASRAVSMPTAMSASLNWIAWWFIIGVPKVFLSNEYFIDSSSALWARPTAPQATGGRVKSKAAMATRNPCPSLPTTFFAGTRTSSNVIPRVSDALWPMLISLRPRVMPGEDLSTMKPVSAWVDFAFGSGLVRARMKYQFAWPAPVIHIFWPLRMYSSPFFTAVVFTAATSDPPDGSVTPYAHTRGSAVMRPMYSFFCSWVPNIKIGVWPRPLPQIAFRTPVQAQAISSSTMPWKVKINEWQCECRQQAQLTWIEQG